MTASPLPFKADALRDQRLADLLGCDLDSEDFVEKLGRLAEVLEERTVGGRAPKLDAITCLRRHRLNGP